MDDELFSERRADKALISSLMQTTQLLWRELEQKRGMLKLLQVNKRRNDMKILQDLKGAYYLVKEYTPLAEEEAKKIVAEAKLIAEDVQHNLQMAEQFLQAEAAKVSGQGAPATPAQGEQSTVTTDPAPTPPADQPQTQPVDQGQTPSADPSQQVPAPTLSTDPNPQPAADPNQVQTQPDPSAAPQLQ